MCKIVLDFKKEYNGKIWYEGEDKIHEALLYFKFDTIKMPFHEVETKNIRFYVNLCGNKPRC